MKATIALKNNNLERASLQYGLANRELALQWGTIVTIRNMEL